MLWMKSLAKSRFVSKSDRYLKVSAGREKLARLGQYTCRFVFIFTGSLLANQLEKHFKFLFKCFGMFKPLHSIQQVVANEKGWKLWSLNSWFSLFRVYSLFLWQLFDHYNILVLFNLVDSKSFNFAPMIPKIVNYLWLSTLFWTIMIELGQIFLYQKEISVNEKALNNKQYKRNEIFIKSALIKKKGNLEKRNATFRKIASCVLDSFVVLKLLRLIDNYDSLIAFFGIVTSFWGIEDIWYAC
ncbi:peroxisomal membrane protein PMP27 [Monosporozyma servazzii]